MKLVQKHLLKGTREFEITDDSIQVRIKTAFKEEKTSLMLSMLNPDPVVNSPYLEFHGRVKSGPLLSLYLHQPDAESFETFVDALKHRAREAYNAFAGLKSGGRPEGLAANSYAEPPEFGEPAKPRLSKQRKPVSAASIDSSIAMLRQHLGSEEIEALLAALEALKSEPENESRLDQLIDAFAELGPLQGAVLTYAPYVSVLLSDDPFDY